VLGVKSERHRPAIHLGSIRVIDPNSSIGEENPVYASSSAQTSRGEATSDNWLTLGCTRPHNHSGGGLNLSIRGT
jgi:hypothetical protein